MRAQKAAMANKSSGDDAPRGNQALGDNILNIGARFLITFTSFFTRRYANARNLYAV